MTNKQVLNEFQTKMKSLIDNCPYRGWELNTSLVNGRIVVSVNDLYADQSIVKGVSCSDLQDTLKLKDFIHSFVEPLNEKYKFIVQIDKRSLVLNKVFPKQIKAGNFYFDLSKEECLKIKDALSDASLLIANAQAKTMKIGVVDLTDFGYEFKKDFA